MLKKLFFALLIASPLLTSCVSNKEMVYIQGSDSLYINPQKIEKDFGLIIQQDDELAISMTSQNSELIEKFNTKILVGSGGGGKTMGSSTTAQANTTSGIAYFHVEKDGCITFPIFGKIKAEGLTIEQLSKYIQDRVRNEGFAKDVFVTTKIMSFKVTVLGDVKAPGVQSYTGERLTLLEALGRAGDLNNSAIRTRVLVIREESGKRVSYMVDLTKPESVFNSPAYYMQQNDLVYVESNKSVKVKGSTSYTYLSVSGTLVGMVASIASLIISLSK